MEKAEKKSEKMTKTKKKSAKTLQKPLRKPSMTGKMMRFAQEYVIDRNATQAAIRAGYSERSAFAQGARLLRKDKVLQEIDRLTQELAEKTKLTAEAIVADLIEVKERCMQRAPVMVREGKEMVQAIDDEGRNVWQFDSKGANRSLELLGKHLGMFVERRELTGRNGGPLQVQASGVLLVPAEVALSDWQQSAQEIAADLEKQMMLALKKQEAKK